MKTKPQTPGQDFERRIDLSAGWAEMNRIIVLRKIEPPTKVIRIGGKPVVIQLRNDCLDYTGTRVVDGRAIWIEAKSTAEPRLGFKVKKSGLTTKQFESLALWYWAGAISGVLWEFRPKAFHAKHDTPPKVVWIPYRLLSQWEEQNAGRKSIPFSLGTETFTNFTGTGQELISFSFLNPIST